MNRLFAMLAASLLVCSSALAQKQPCAMPGENNAFLGIQTIRLWPGDAPQAKGNACEDVPTLTIFEPQQGHANGSAVVILPGGAYVNLAANLEGRQVADWFTARGFRAFILSYRLSSNGYLLPVPLLDARRAIQTGARARARLFHRSESHRRHRLFRRRTPGGALRHAVCSRQPRCRRPHRPRLQPARFPGPRLSVDRRHLQRHFAPELLQAVQRDGPCEALRTAYSPDLFVTKDTPPTFWYHTFDDETVPVEQGLRFYEALVKAGVPAEAHIFAHGPHGSGFGKGDRRARPVARVCSKHGCAAWACSRRRAGPRTVDASLRRAQQFPCARKCMIAFFSWRSV